METIYCGISGKEKLISLSDVKACEARRKSVENAMAIMLSATNGPDEMFLAVLDSYIFGEITLDEMEERINRFEYCDEGAAEKTTASLCNALEKDCIKFIELSIQ